jgi:hypothetical protein
MSQLGPVIGDRLANTHKAASTPHLSQRLAQAPGINLGTMPVAAAASVSAAPAAVSPAPVWPMAAPPRAYRGFDADVFAQQL